MENKLTLRLGDHLIARAKKLAKKNGKSVSQMVADYFRSLAGQPRHPLKDIPLTPKVAGLLGSLKGSSVTAKDYRRHLEEKYL